MGYAGVIDKARPPPAVKVGGPQELATGTHFKMTPFQIAKENPFKEATRYDASMRSRDFDHAYGEPKSEGVSALRQYELKGES